MATAFSFVEIPEEVLPIIGERDGDSHVYRKSGSQEESSVWFDALHKIVGQTVSPGGVGMYCPVSRAAVYKRIKEGNLSLFLFHVTKRTTTLFGGKKVVREKPYSYIPVSEVRAWRKDLEERAIAQGNVTREQLEGARPDWEGDFVDWHSRWQKEQLKKAGGRK